MNTAARLGIYGAGLVLAFGGTFAIAAAVVPDATVAAWSQDDRGAHSDPATSTTAPPATTQEEQEIDVTGATIAQSGFMMGPIQAPSVPGETSTLSFQILDGAGAPVTAFETAHGKDLHLITVRTDGTGYRHVHGDPVTDLEPYLGAFGHLVALRQGDLAYLHVHAHGDEPQPGDLAGPDVAFTAEAPTTGRYLLYLDFQVDGQVHTAQFVLDAIPPTDSAGVTDEPAGTGGDAEHDGH